MSAYHAAITQWAEKLLEYRLPRWEDLPDIDLYMDQVITIIEKYVTVFPNDGTKIITPAMVNNYVKLGMMPKPEKKRYNRTHLAYLIAITILKQVLTITEVKDGILLQSNINGTKDAYNLFCTEQELALKNIAHKALLEPVADDNDTITKENLAVKMATTAFACKILTEKILELRQSDLVNLTIDSK